MYPSQAVVPWEGNGSAVNRERDGGRSQDLRDALRGAGEAVYTEVDGAGAGVAEFATRKELERALRTLQACLCVCARACPPFSPAGSVCMPARPPARPPARLCRQVAGE